MRTSLLYALLFAVPSGTAMGSGMFLITGQQAFGLAMGLGVGLLVFGLVFLGSEYGTADERLREEP